MKKDSIFFAVTVSFVLSIILLIISFSFVLLNNHKENENILKKKYFPIVSKFLKVYKKLNANSSFVRDFKNMNIEILTNRKEKSALLYNPKTKVLIQRELKNYIVRVINLNKTNYMYIKRKSIKSTVDVFILKTISRNVFSSQKNYGS